MTQRTRRSGALFSVYDSRILAIEALVSIVQGKDALESLEQAIEALRHVPTEVGDDTIGHCYERFATLLDVVCHLLRWARAIRSAEFESDRHLRAAKQGAMDFLRSLDSGMENERLAAVAREIEGVSELQQIEEIAQMILYNPLPLPLFRNPPKPAPLSYESQLAVQEEAQISVAFVSFYLNENTFEDPQTVEPEILHDLSVEVRLSQWPELAEKLELDVSTVELTESYDMPMFSFFRPEGDPPFILRGTERMLLRVPQAIASRPLEFVYRARFLPEDHGAKVSVEGQRHLHIQSFDPERNPLTGYKDVDRQLYRIRAEARSMPAVPDDELRDFLIILASLGNVAGQALQDNVFSGGWSESDFQSDIRRRLRDLPQIGSELEEHPHAAGGITDISFRGIRIELKVEPGNLVTVENSKQWLPQTSQYVAGSDRRLGVLCVLDTSTKTTAPGSVANDIVLLQVPPPGRSDGIPLLVGLVIIRGNLSRPSDLSRS